MSRNITIAITQMACTPEFEENRDRAEKLIRDAASKGAQVILLQELFEGPGRQCLVCVLGSRMMKNHCVFDVFRCLGSPGAS